MYTHNARKTSQQNNQSQAFCATKPIERIRHIQIQYTYIYTCAHVPLHPHSLCAHVNCANDTITNAKGVYGICAKCILPYGEIA